MFRPCLVGTCFIAGLWCLSASAQTPHPANPVPSRPVPSRIVSRIDDTRLVKLPGNTHPLARAEFDQGLLAADTPLQRVVLVLKRSPEQDAALAAFNQRQYDPKSPDFHHWLHADEFGQLYGPSDADIAQITGWLQGHGFTIDDIGKGRLAIQFSGTAAQVQTAFHVQMHRYTVSGESHFANDRDPQIPDALSPVVSGVASLNNFLPKHQSHPGAYVRRDRHTGEFTPVPAEPAQAEPAAALQPASSQSAATQSADPTPELTYTSSYSGVHEDVTPFDFATIYNILPLWNAGINGAGVTIAIAGESDIQPTDIATFRSSFGLPPSVPTIIHNGVDPGLVYGSQNENTLDVEMAGSSAPGATIALVVSKTATSVDLSTIYVIDNEVAPILSLSYGQCELALGTTGNSFYGQLFQQGATSGISIFVAAGDEGSAGCTNRNASTPYEDTYGLAVNGFASSPFVTAVGGTDLNWGYNRLNPTPISTYWNTANSAQLATAKGYIPEIAWNTTCANPALLNYYLSNATTPQFNSNQDLCSLAVSSLPGLVEVAAGSGGASSCTTPSGTTPSTCAGGYAKPSWQTGQGVPADGKRDLPDVSMFASYGYYNTSISSSTLLLCQASGSSQHSCNFSDPNYIIYQENGGTSASSPLTAGIMALVIQKTGQQQGLANPGFYALAAKQNNSACNSNTVQPGNSCVFYDTTSGSNAQVCKIGDPNCVDTNTSDSVGVLSGYSAGAGYDLATGLGSMNVANLVNAWSSVVPPVPIAVTLTPTMLPATTVGADYTQQLSASGGLSPYTFFISAGTLPSWLTLSPSGLLTGVPPSITTNPSFTVTARDSSSAGPFTGSQAYSLSVAAAAAPAAISWIPSSLSTYSGIPLGAGVLDATTAAAGSFTYTATLAGGSPTTLTSTSHLAAGSYTLTATFAPTGGGINPSATIPFNVIPEHVFILNTSGNVFGLDAGGNQYYGSFTGGYGLTVGRDGSLWSGNLSGGTLATITSDAATYGSNTASGGLTTPAGLAVDGNGYIWAVNANNSLSEFNTSGIALSPSTGFTGGSLSTPTGIAIDNSGNVWIANSGNNSVTEVLGAATPVAPLVPAIMQNNPGAKP